MLVTPGLCDIFKWHCEAKKVGNHFQSWPKLQTRRQRLLSRLVEQVNYAMCSYIAKHVNTKTAMLKMVVISFGTWLTRCLANSFYFELLRRSSFPQVLFVET